MSEPWSAHAPSPVEVRAQLERLLCSQALRGSDQLKRLLQRVVEAALTGQAELLKEYNLGLEVFQRPPDYDPKIDPIVRVQARRLRAKLEEYYGSTGAQDSLVIRIPKGAYVPEFETRVPAGIATAPAQGPEKGPRRPRIWQAVAGVAVLAALVAAVWGMKDLLPIPADTNRSVAVLPLQMFAEGGSRGHIANEVMELLTTELAKHEQLRVLSRTTASRYRETGMSLPDIARALGVRWVVEGGVGVEGSRVYVKLRAVDSRTDRKIWADVFDCDAGELVPVSARAADRIAEAIATSLRASGK